MTPKRNIAKVAIRKIERGRASAQKDVLAVEEPLEIRLAGEAAGRRFDESVAVTMRTPGDDYELAAGFLFCEGILKDAEEVREITYCVGPDKRAQRYNVVRVQLRPGVVFDPARLQRHFYMNSSCGVCGKASLEALRAQGCPVLPQDKFEISSVLISDLPEKVRGRQAVFDKTGGLHAAALFDSSGKLLGLREDVGRHNAVDKLIGEQFLNRKLPCSGRLMLVSGRTSFELIQKALMAGIPIVAAVGAPSSLAVELAREFGMTLLGFVRAGRFNIYSGEERILS